MDVPVNTVMSREMVQLAMIPKDMVIGAPVQIQDVLGRRTNRRLAMGDQIRSSDLYLAGEVPSVDLKAKSGMRAIAIGGGEVQFVGTAVQPDSHVDLIVTYQDPKLQRLVTRIIAQNIRVLAVNKGRMDADLKAGGANTSITLEVAPTEIELVKAAESSGSLCVTLRNPGDTSLIETVGENARDFMACWTAMESEKPIVESATKLIPIIPGRSEVTIIRGTIVTRGDNP
jgi:Flp pilus assembly protein CpaB